MQVMQHAHTSIFCTRKGPCQFFCKIFAIVIPKGARLQAMLMKRTWKTITRKVSLVSVHTFTYNETHILTFEN